MHPLSTLTGIFQGFLWNYGLVLVVECAEIRRLDPEGQRSANPHDFVSTVVASLRKVWS